MIFVDLRNFREERELLGTARPKLFTSKIRGARFSKFASTFDSTLSHQPPPLGKVPSSLGKETGVLPELFQSYLCSSAQRALIKILQVKFYFERIRKSTQFGLNGQFTRVRLPENPTYRPALEPYVNFQETDTESRLVWVVGQVLLSCSFIICHPGDFWRAYNIKNNKTMENR